MLISREVRERRFYQAAYSRERKAREFAELVMEDRTRDLYSVNQALRDSHQRLEEQRSHLVQSEKLAAIGVLSAGIAHEVNNPLAFVISDLKVLQEYHHMLVDYVNRAESDADSERESCRLGFSVDDLTNDSMDIFEGVYDGLRRISEIVKGMKEYVRRSDHVVTQVDIDKVIQSSMRICHNQYKHCCDLDLSIARPLPLVNANENEMVQVLVNLLLNALHATEGCDTRRVQISVRANVDHDTVTIVVTDTGKGISPEKISQVFDPFYTDKPVGQGTGLGLYICLNLVRSWGGEISVGSELGSGASFTVVLNAVSV